MKKHNSSENMYKSNNCKEITVDLWEINPYSNPNKRINKSKHYDKYTNSSITSSNTKQPIKRTKSVDKSNPIKYNSNNNSNLKKQKASTSLPKQTITTNKKNNPKSNFNISLSDFNNPDNVIKYIKNKCGDNTKPSIKDYDSSTIPNEPNSKVKPKHIRKSSQEIQSISNKLYNRKTVSSNYQLQLKMKKISDDKRKEEELSQCTFKPKLYTSNQKRKKEQGNKNMYEQQNKWLNTVNEKKEKNYEMKQMKELEHCSFNPKINKMPDFNKGNYVNKTNVEKELYYSKLKRASQDKQKLTDKEKDFAKCYDERRKKENMIRQQQLQKEGIYSAPSYHKEQQPNTDANSCNVTANCSKKEIIKSNQISDVNLDRVINNNNYISGISSPYVNINVNGINGNNYVNQVDYDFEMKKEMLMKDLHDWKNDNDEDEEDDFFS